MLEFEQAFEQKAEESFTLDIRVFHQQTAGKGNGPRPDFGGSGGSGSGSATTYCPDSIYDCGVTALC